MARDFGRELGPRTRRDAIDPSGLRVDYTYEDATPRLALEISTGQDDKFLAGASSAGKLEKRLNQVAAEESLGGYSVELQSNTPMNEVEPLILEVMRRGEDVSLTYSSDDLTRWKSDGTYSWQKKVRAEFKRLRVVRVARNTQINAVTMHTWGGESLGEWRGFDDADLQIKANMAKFIEAQGYEGHLGIGNNRFRVSNDASRSPVPDLPSGLARLWVVHLWTTGECPNVVWSLGAGE